VFDGLVATGLVFLAWRSLQAPHLFTSVVLFIAFGLLMALAWVRLDASDIALAEAAIGAGITGALLLDALGHVAGKPRARPGDEPASPAFSRAMPEQGAIRSVGRRGRLFLAAPLAPLAAVIALGVWTMPDAQVVRDAVAGALEHHPVANPATAVLLDFRAYDTFLEMGVLALAALGAFLLKAQTLHQPRAEAPTRGSLVLLVFAAGLVPLMILVAGYLLWAGTAWSGGAFPAGAILGAAAVLLFLAGIGRDMIVDHDPTRLVIALGLLSFIAAGAVAMLAGRAFLDWGEQWTYAAVVGIEAALTLSIGGVLALLYGASAKVPPDVPDTVEGVR
jgi:multisubunit Na+/H+ antiporter MnhB subunit